MVRQNLLLLGIERIAESSKKHSSQIWDWVALTKACSFSMGSSTMKWSLALSTDKSATINDVKKGFIRIFFLLLASGHQNVNLVQTWGSILSAKPKCETIEWRVCNAIHCPNYQRKLKKALISRAILIIYELSKSSVFFAAHTVVIHRQSYGRL